MVILKDIAPVLTRYESVGFQRVDAGTAGCVGMQAGTTAVIFGSVGFMNEDYGSDHIARLVGKTIQYVHVFTVDEVKGRLTASAQVLQVRRLTVHFVGLQHNTRGCLSYLFASAGRIRPRRLDSKPPLPESRSPGLIGRA